MDTKFNSKKLTAKSAKLTSFFPVDI